MATGHSLSVVTNSCIKTPLNPRTKLSATLNERENSRPNSLHQSWGEQNGFGVHNGAGVIEKSPTKDSPRSVDFSTADGMINSLTNELGNLSDSEFYAKLTELRQEHKRTLGIFESMYNEKLQEECNDYEYYGDNDYYGETHFQTSQAPSFSRGPPIYVTDHKLHHIDDEIEAFNKSQPSWSALKDNVKDMSSGKPPTGRSRSAWSGSGSQKQRLHRTGSVSGDESTRYSSMSSSRNLSRSYESLTSSAANSRRQSRSSTPVAAVEDMWEDFSLDDYMPRPRSVASSSRSSSSKKKNWSPKITIPQPFKMTQREKCKERSKSRTLLEHEQELLEKEKQLEAECNQKFTATPVPGHTYLPLFDEIMERQEERRRKNQELSHDLLKSTEKPFAFLKRELEKKQNQQKSFKTIAPKPKKPQFKAKPAPKEMLNSSIDEKIAEEEEYRKIRIKMRSEELLRQSSLPPNMQIKGKEYTDGKMRQKMYKKRAKNAFLTADHKFHPNINSGEVPDYEEMHWKFKMKMDRQKQVKEPTIVEPFNLRTARIPSKKEKILQDISQDEETLTEQRWPFMSSRSSMKFSHGSTNIPDDVIPTKTTHTSALRDSLKQQRKEEETKRRQEIVEKEKEKQMRERKLKRFIVEKAMANDNSRTLESTQKNKLQRHREADRARQEEYGQEIREMMSRVENRPLLFERESQVNAKRKAERKYQQALLDAGIEEDFLLRKSRGAQVSTNQTNGINHSEDEEDEYKYSFEIDDDDRYMGSRDESSFNQRTYSKTDDVHVTSDGLSDGDKTESSIRSEDDYENDGDADA